MKRMLLNAVFALVMVSSFTCLNAQTTNVLQGTIKDEKGEPVIGAAVTVKGTTIGTVTDIDGKYSLAVPPGSSTLVVKYIGYKTQEVSIAGGKFNITLPEDVLGLDEVVVTAVAINREKRSLGYSTTTVNSEDLNNVAPVSALDALQGKVAGLQIDNTSGAPGGSTRVVLRGGSSLTGDNNALIVIDGVPIDNSDFGFADILNNGYDAGSRANDINPEDIESVTVLKGAAAVALYGQRGANGAIMYTTKSGKDVVKSGRKFKVSISEDMSAATPLKLPTLQNQFGQGSQDNFGNPYFDTRQNWSWGPAFNGQPMFWGTPIAGPNGTEEIQVKNYAAEPNNIKDFFNVGGTYNTNLSLSGGDDKGSLFFISYNNSYYNGIVPTTNYNRNSIKLNVSHQFSDNLSISATFNYTNTNSVLPLSSQTNQGIMNLVLNTPRDIPMNELSNLSSPFNQPAAFYDLFYPNPYWALANERTTDNVNHFLSSANAEWKPAKWLTFTGRFGADIYTDTRQQDFAKYSFLGVNFFQGSVLPNPDTTNYIGKYDQDQYTVENINADIMANLHWEFKHDVTFSVLLGSNIYSNKSNETYGETNGLILPNYYNFLNTVATPTLYNYELQNRLLAGYADVSIGYKNFLFFDITGRNDWSSTLPLGNRSFFYPSFSSSLVFTDMLKKRINPMILSYGKVFASVAQIGKDAPPYSLLSYFTPGYVYDDLEPNGAIKTPYVSPVSSTVAGYQLSNTEEAPNLKPEISTDWEAGVNLAFLQDRLSVDATYYYKLSINEIITIPVAPSTGYDFEVINAGTLRNEGVELGFRIIPITTKSGFKWEVYGTWAKNYSKVLHVAGTTNQINLGGLAEMSEVDQVGLPAGTFYGTGVQTTSSGQIIVQEGVGLPQATTKPETFGSYQPNWIGSIGTSLSYKGFKFNILFGGNEGGEFYSNSASLDQFTGNALETAANNRQNFVVPNSVYMGTDGKYHPNTTAVSSYNYWFTVSELIPQYQLIPASFLKLREISLTYSFPKKMLSKSKYMTGVSVKVYGSNLWLWTPKANQFVDPELNASGSVAALQGFEYLNVPSVRNFGGGFTIDF